MSSPLGCARNMKTPGPSRIRATRQMVDPQRSIYSLPRRLRPPVLRVDAPVQNDFREAFRVREHEIDLHLGRQAAPRAVLVQRHRFHQGTLPRLSATQTRSLGGQPRSQPRLSRRLPRIRGLVLCRCFGANHDIEPNVALESLCRSGTGRSLPEPRISSRRTGAPPRCRS